MIIALLTWAFIERRKRRKHESALSKLRDSMVLAQGGVNINYSVNKNSQPVEMAGPQDKDPVEMNASVKHVVRAELDGG